MKDGRQLESLDGVDAPEVLYDILLKDYRARGVTLMPLQEDGNLVQSEVLKKVEDFSDDSGDQEGKEVS